MSLLFIENIKLKLQNKFFFFSIKKFFKIFIIYIRFNKLKIDILN
jgi:hypothetical protein